MLNIEDIGEPIAVIQKPKDKGLKNMIVSINDTINIKAIKPFTRLKLEDESSFMPIPNPNKERTVFFVSGQSGSGKSYFSAEWVNNYKKMYPDNDVYLFSPLLEDESIDKIKGLKKVAIDDNLLNSELSTQDFPNSCVIFDDIEAISNKKLKDKVYSILNSILTTGRHTKTSCLFLSHLATAGNDTKIILNESHGVVFFPNTMGLRNLKYLLESYYGMDKNEIKKIKNLESRWVCIIKSFPKVVISQKEIYIPSKVDII
jgi:hypothetical protein